MPSSTLLWCGVMCPRITTVPLTCKNSKTSSTSRRVKMRRCVATMISGPVSDRDATELRMGRCVGCVAGCVWGGPSDAAPPRHSYPHNGGRTRGSHVAICGVAAATQTQGLRLSWAGACAGIVVWNTRHQTSQTMTTGGPRFVCFFRSPGTRWRTWTRCLK